ncbi:MAG TPA: FAD-binding oxidoreductase [Acidimicrobiales bacterium]|nr:FAD-binding oxidoreductase [Acidimicrobiales bacterium]
MSATNRGAPTPPIAFAGSDITARFAAAAVTIPGDVVTRLRDACATVDDANAVAEAGRDWWPVAMHWALHGETPARAGVLARPTSTEEVAAVLRICNDARVPVTPVAGRSGVCGASIPVFGGVGLDLTAMTGIVDVDDASLLVTARAGTFGDVFEDELRATHNLTCGHWPQSINLSTVGGWAACRGAGQYSTRYGKIEDIVRGLEVVLANGTVVHTGGRGPRQAVGPDLNQLFVGSEGTLGVITEVQMRVHPVPTGEAKAAFGFESFAAGLEACRLILRADANPAVLRLYDARESRRHFATPRGQCVLLVLDEAAPALVAANMAVAEDACAKEGASALDAHLVDHWLERRNDVAGLETAVRNGLVVDTTEISGRWRDLPAIYDAVVAAMDALPGTVAVTSHQSHAYTDGACLYFTWAGQPSPETGGVEGYYNAAWDLITNTVLAHGGALSHHHGVGLNRSRFLVDALGQPGYDVLCGIKAALDPNGILNPGKFFPSTWGPVPWH